MKCISCSILCTLILIIGLGYGVYRGLVAFRQLGVDSVCFEASLKSIKLDNCKP